MSLQHVKAPFINRILLFCFLLTAYCLYVWGTGCARVKAGRGVTTFPEGTHRTGHGALRTTRSISEPSAGAPPKSEAWTVVPTTIRSASILAASLTISA